MTEAEIERYAEEELRALGADFSVASIEEAGDEAWDISMRCPRCGDFHFTVRECGDSPISEQIKSNLRTHTAAH